MKAQLTSGKNIQLGVHHSKELMWKNKQGEVFLNLRGTTINFSLKNGEDSVYDTVVSSICIPPDQFSKKCGRRIAGIKLLKDLNNNGFSKQERKEIFQLICPEFFKRTNGKK